MTEIEKDNLEFDEKIIINKSECCFCKIELNADNRSIYRMHFKTDNNPSIGCLCLNCREVWERLNKIKNGIMSNSEVEIKIRQSIYSEGWTNEMLKAKEEQEFAVLN